MLNHSQKNEECKKTPQKWAKRTQNARFRRFGHRCEFFMFVPTSAMPERSIPKVSEKNTQSFSKNGKA